MATTIHDFMKHHVETWRRDAAKASPERRREMIEAIVLAVSDVMADQGLPFEPLELLTGYLRGQPGDAELYQNLSACLDTLHMTFMEAASHNHQATAAPGKEEGSTQVHAPVGLMRALTLSTMMTRTLAAASSVEKDEVYLAAGGNALLDAMNLSNLMGGKNGAGLKRFASAWQHRLGGTRAVTGFFAGSAGSA